MGSSPSTNQKKSHETLSSSAADVAPTDGQITLSVPHVRRSNAAFSYDSTQFGSHVMMDDEMSTSVIALSESQQTAVRMCLWQLETNFGISLNCDKLMNYVKTLTIGPGDKLLSPETLLEEGIFIIEEGALEVCTIGKLEPVARLLKGDFCGELTALFGGSGTAIVQCSLLGQTKCLFVATQDLQNHWLDGSLNEAVKLSWCIKRCYVDFTNMFPSGHLASQILHTALQASKPFDDWYDEAISKLAGHMQLVLFSDGDNVIARGQVTYQLFFLLRGSVTMESDDGVQEFKCVKSCDEGYTLLTKEFFTGQPSSWSISCNAPTLLSCLSKEDIVTTLTEYPDLSTSLTNKIASL